MHSFYEEDGNHCGGSVRPSEHENLERGVETLVEVPRNF